MRSLLLCEGSDDAYVIGYYLYGASEQKWKRNNKTKFSENYLLSKVTSKNESIDIYEKDEDVLAIWGIGGKDNFTKPFKTISNICQEHPGDGIDQLFIFLDRDESDISHCLKKLEADMSAVGLNVPRLKNSQENVMQFQSEEESYGMKIIPIIIPFDEHGALENVLLNGLASEDEESKCVVEKAKNYVRCFYKSDIRKRYLSNERLKTKAQFSAAIAITNPDHSTKRFDQLLTAHEWYDNESVKNHFKMINKLLLN